MDPILQKKSAETADDAADENDERQTILAEADRFGQAFYGKWAVGVDAPVTLGARALGRGEERLGRREFRHQAVKQDSSRRRHDSPIFPIPRAAGRASRK